MKLEISYYVPYEHPNGQKLWGENFTEVENIGITKDGYLFVKHGGTSETRPILGILSAHLTVREPFNWEAEDAQG